MTFPPEIREALRQRTAVLVTGTGCGALCGQPGWPARLEALAAALPPARATRMRALLEREEWGAALVAARYGLGAQAAQQVVARLTGPGSDRVPAVFTALASASWRAVITTGFDETWARALAATGQAPTVLSAGEPVAQAKGGRMLIHPFGRAAKPETLCLGPADLPARVAAPGLQDLLRDLARACSFLYVGFQPADPDLEWLTGLVLGPAARERPHFALVTGAGAGGGPAFRGSSGIRPIAFDGSLEVGLAALAEVAAEAAGMEAMLELGTGEMELVNEDPVDVRARVPQAAPPPRSDRTVAPEATGVPLRQSIREAIDGHIAQQRWADASDELHRLVYLEPDDGARAKLLYTRALLSRDWLDDRAGAIVLLEQALEADPAFVPAWDALEPLQRGGGDPVALRRCYARALRTLGKTADRALAVRLWSSLAEVSWRALGDHSTAVAAFEAARTLSPDDEGPELALAALYLKLGSSASDKAVAAHQALAARTPDEAEPYRVLERLWTEGDAPEKAAWASAVLAQLGQATAHQAGPRKSTYPGRPTTLSRALSEPLWEGLYHPEEDRVLSTLFLVLGPSLVALMAEPQKSPPMKGEAVPAVQPSATRPSRAAAGPVSNDFAPAALAHVSYALAVPPPALFLVKANRHPLTVRLRAGGSTVKHALMLDRRFADAAPEADVLFELARTVALLRPPWLLRFGVRVPAVVDLGLRAAFALNNDATRSAGGGKRDVLRLLQHLREERPDLAQEQVAALASELSHRPQPPDLGRWLAAIELSAARAALAITGDLDAAIRSVSAESTRPGGLGPRERVKDLLAFAVSEDHFSVRAALDLDVQERMEALARAEGGGSG